VEYKWVTADFPNSASLYNKFLDPMFPQGYHSLYSDRATCWTFAVHFPARARKFSPHGNVQNVPGEYSASQSRDIKGSSSIYKEAKA
jgi:hypothetical protein